MSFVKTVTNSLASLKTLFNKIDEVYYASKASDLMDNKADMEWPVISDGVTFNTGDLDITKVKLTTGATWVSFSELGDSDIQFQVASVSNKIVKLFFPNNGGGNASYGPEGDTTEYKFQNYGIEPSKLTGALLLCSEDKQTVILLPNIEAYGSMTIEDGKPMYINVSVTPLADADGNAIKIGSTNEE